MTRQAYVEAARARAHALYLGETVAHHSCGIALAATFGLPTRSYQSLRKGGLTGLGTCGALQAGALVLGEILGDPDPGGAPTAELKVGIERYRLALGLSVAGSPDASCNERTAPFTDFASRDRVLSCTELAASAAAAVAGVLHDLGRGVGITG
ncbi:MAG: hypothetical protein EXR71_04865 [Myxococcales bacterium]|nr:hypothetical protein [Myxococcales bacterium]